MQSEGVISLFLFSTSSRENHATSPSAISFASPPPGRKTIPGTLLTFFDINNKPIHEKEKVFFLDAPYLHVTHLKRSNSPRKYNKFKYELGESFPVNFKFPEVLLKPFPDIVSSPWGKISGVKKIWAQLLTPLRKIKRRLK